MDTGNTPLKNHIAFINDKSPILDLIFNDLVASGLEVVFRSENIKDGLSELSTLQELPTAIITDLDFYDDNVLEQLRELKTKYPTVRLIAHSDIDDIETAKALSEIGIESYLLIGSDVDDFKKAIEKA